MNSQKTPCKSVLIAGCGAIGRLLARRWREICPDTPLNALVATAVSAQDLKADKVSAQRCNLDDPDPRLDSPPSELIYYFVPPPQTGVEDTRCAHFLTALQAQSHRPERIVAISTTGVYGDCAGQRVTEDQPVNPVADRARRRYDMEQQLRQWCEQHNVALIILRVGGIYGPDRLPLERIRKGIPMLRPSLAPSTNRIHEYDLVSICLAAAAVKQTYRIYNVSDGSDSNMAEYFNTLADHFSLPRPPAIDWQQAEQQISAGMLSYLKESRRVDNTRMLNELGITLRYPGLKQALIEMFPQT